MWSSAMLLARSCRTVSAAIFYCRDGIESRHWPPQSKQPTSARTLYRQSHQIDCVYCHCATKQETVLTFGQTVLLNWQRRLSPSLCFHFTTPLFKQACSVWITISYEGKTVGSERRRQLHSKTYDWLKLKLRWMSARRKTMPIWSSWWLNEKKNSRLLFWTKSIDGKIRVKERNGVLSDGSTCHQKFHDVRPSVISRLVCIQPFYEWLLEGWKKGRKRRRRRKKKEK